MAMSDEEFLAIAEKKFNFGDYFKACVKYWDEKNNTISNFDAATGEKINIPDDIKYLFSMLKGAIKTETGEKVLRELDDNIKINFMIDESLKNECWGYSTQNHQVVITDKEQDINCNVTTFVHELTHEVQKQRGGHSSFLVTEQDRFMVNKMMEAEARLNTAKVAFETCLTFNGDAEKIKDFVGKLEPQTFRDIVKYKDLQDKGLSNEDINRQMLEVIYRDANWSEGYNQQALRSAANYKTSSTFYQLAYGKDSEEVKMGYMKRLGLNEEDKEHFFNPDNIASYPHDQIKQKSGNSGDFSVPRTSFVDVYEDGVRTQRTYFDNETHQKLCAERYVDGVRNCVVYDNQGKLSAAFSEYEKDGVYYKDITRLGDRYIIETEGKHGKVISIKDEKGNIVADANEVNRQDRQIHSVFEKLRASEQVDDVELKQAYQTIKEDKYGLYAENYIALSRVIIKEAEDRGLDAKENTNTQINEVPTRTEEPKLNSVERNIQQNDIKQEKRSSEEIIVDALIKSGTLSAEQENKIIEMAVEIEKKRTEDKSSQSGVKGNYAEQFVDKIIASGILNEEQQSHALKAAVIAEQVEIGLDRLRGKVRPLEEKTSSLSGKTQPIAGKTIDPQMAAMVREKALDR